MKKRLNFSWSIAIISLLAIVGCKKEKITPVDQPNFITTSGKGTGSHSGSQANNKGGAQPQQLTKAKIRSMKAENTKKTFARRDEKARAEGKKIHSQKLLISTKKNIELLSTLIADKTLDLINYRKNPDRNELLIESTLRTIDKYKRDKSREITDKKTLEKELEKLDKEVEDLEEDIASLAAEYDAYDALYDNATD